MKPAGETNIGGVDRDLPPTRWTLIQGARGPASPARADAINELCRLYWKPVYCYIRRARGKDNEDAKDLTQEFLIELIEGGMLSRFAPDRGTFRTYLLGAARLFLLEHHRTHDAHKRGGGRTILSWDESDLPVDGGGATPEEAFDRQWATVLIDDAVAALRRELAGAGKDVYFRLFDRHTLNPPVAGAPGYDELSAEFGVKQTDVANYLHYCRRRLRDLIVDRVRDYAADDATIAAELAHYFTF